MEFVFGQLIKNMNNKDTYIPTDNTCNVKFIRKENDEIFIEPIIRGFPMVVKDSTVFIKVEEC